MNCICKGKSRCVLGLPARDPRDSQSAHIRDAQERHAVGHVPDPQVETRIRQSTTLGESAHGLGLDRRPNLQSKSRIQLQRRRDCLLSTNG